MKKHADKVLAEYIRSHGLSEPGAHGFITESLDKVSIEDITKELKEILDMDPSNAKEKLSRILESQCAQDLYERGAFPARMFEICSMPCVLDALIFIVLKLTTDDIPFRCGQRFVRKSIEGGCQAPW